MTSRPPWVAGNWKMHLLRAEARTLAKGVAAAAAEAPHADVAIFPATTSLDVVRVALEGTGVILGAQACHPSEKGAHTGEVSAAMLVDAGCQAVLCGHSERRAAGESDERVGANTRAALDAGLRALVCVGEVLDEREAGRTAEVVVRQLDAALDSLGESDLDALDIAYEPVWAIGTGKTATPGIAAEAHATIRARMVEKFGEPGREPRILYGGSVKPGNAAELMAAEGVDGVLVGGASLDADSFRGIILSA